MEKIRVLITDDHTIMREGLCLVLESEPDIEVVGEAFDGQDAVEKTRTILPDVIVMDIDMPRMNGLEATRAIKKEHPEISILILTAHDDDEYVYNLLKAGATGYLLKKSSGYSLASSIRTVRNGEFSLAPQIAAKLVTSYLQPLQEDKTGAEDDFVGNLTDLEIEIMRLIVDGLALKEIAGRMSLDIRAVEKERTHIFRKLDIHERGEKIDSSGIDMMRRIVKRYDQSTVDFLASEAPRFKDRFDETQSPDGIVTIMFTDLEGFTDLTEKVGDEAAYKLLHRCNALIREAVNEARGYEVKTIGDAFMVAFRSARAAIQCALDVQRAIETLNSANKPEQQLSLRIGLNTGEPIKQENDFFGSAVNLAARIEREARGGEILVSELVHRMVGKMEGVTFISRGSFVPKGFGEECQVYLVVADKE